MNKIVYFTLKVSVDPKVVGHSSQINDAKNITKEDIDTFDKFVREDKFPSKIPCSDSFKLHPRSKLTDMMSNKYINTPEGFVVNSKFYELLKKFALSNVRFYDIKILSNRDIGKFKQIFIISSPEIIDFSRSVFQEVDIMKKTIEKYYTFNSLEEFSKKYDETINDNFNTIAPKLITLNKTPDLFKLLKYNEIFVSEKLKNTIEKNAITGAKIGESKVKMEFQK